MLHPLKPAQVAYLPNQANICSPISLSSHAAIYRFSALTLFSCSSMLCNGKNKDCVRFGGTHREWGFIFGSDVVGLEVTGAQYLEIWMGWMSQDSSWEIPSGWM